MTINGRFDQIYGLGSRNLQLVEQLKWVGEQGMWDERSLDLDYPLFKPWIIPLLIIHSVVNVLVGFQMELHNIIGINIFYLNFWTPLFYDLLPFNTNAL